MFWCASASFIYFIILISYEIVIIGDEMLELEHAPNLNTVLMVEEVLKSMDESAITVADLKRKLPRQVNHTMLHVILEYLETSNKIAVSMRGITWVHNTNPNLRKAITEGLEL